MEAKLADALIHGLNQLNKTIREDALDLGEGFCIGHSYFLAFKFKSHLGAERLRFFAQVHSLQNSQFREASGHDKSGLWEANHDGFACYRTVALRLQQAPC